MKTIGIFLHHPECSHDCVDGMTLALHEHYTIKTFHESECNPQTLATLDAVAFPGGIGDAMSYDKFFRRKAQNAVADYVTGGGKYLGICMGAYWADKDYFDILDDVRVVQYIKQPNTCTRRPHAKNMPTNWFNGHYEKMFFYDGPTFTGHGSYKTIAAYDTTGYPMAIKQNNVLLIGCHPESEKFWYDSYSWLKGNYHDGVHHEILLDLIDEFLER